MTDLTAKGEAAYQSAVRMAETNGQRRPDRAAFAHISDQENKPTEKQEGVPLTFYQQDSPLSPEALAALERMKESLVGQLPRGARQ